MSPVLVNSAYNLRAPPNVLEGQSTLITKYTSSLASMIKYSDRASATMYPVFDDECADNWPIEHVSTRLLMGNCFVRRWTDHCRPITCGGDGITRAILLATYLVLDFWMRCGHSNDGEDSSGWWRREVQVPFKLVGEGRCRGADDSIVSVDQKTSICSSSRRRRGGDPLEPRPIGGRGLHRCHHAVVAAAVCSEIYVYV